MNFKIWLNELNLNNFKHINASIIMSYRYNQAFIYSHKYKTLYLTKMAENESSSHGDITDDYYDKRESGEISDEVYNDLTGIYYGVGQIL